MRDRAITWSKTDEDEEIELFENFHVEVDLCGCSCQRAAENPQTMKVMKAKYLRSRGRFQRSSKRSFRPVGGWGEVYARDALAKLFTSEN